MTSVIVDTNLLILLVVGSTNRDYITKHKRLKVYSESDYDLLLETISGASKIVVTPHILTETSNLLAYIGEPAKTEIRIRFRTMIGLEATEERTFESKTISGKAEFLRLGLADVSLLEACAMADALITDDLELYLAALHRGYRAENFTYTREAAGTL